MSYAVEVDEASIPEDGRAWLAYRSAAAGRLVAVAPGPARTARLACDDREDAVFLRDGLVGAGMPVTAMRVVSS